MSQATYPRHGRAYRPTIFPRYPRRATARRRPVIVVRWFLMVSPYGCARLLRAGDLVYHGVVGRRRDTGAFDNQTLRVLLPIQLALASEHLHISNFAYGVLAAGSKHGDRDLWLRASHRER